MRKAIYLVGSLVIIVALGIVATVIVVDVKHPRDEGAYVAYLTKYGSTNGTKIELPATESLVAEGDHACNWLGDAPTALWRTGDRYRFPAVSSRYQHVVRGQALAWGNDPPTRSTITSAAWGYLCPGTWQLHKPHYIFSQPNPAD